MSERHPTTIGEFVLRVAERFGLPVVVLGILLWMVKDTATTLHGTVVLPMVKAHTEFLGATQAAITEISHSQSQQAETMQELAAGSREIKELLMSGRASAATSKSE
jgi:hypothetical protein